jgi:L-threonate 2-dehydrogenase
MHQTQIKTIGFIGLGAMGMGMASSLLRAGFTVSGYDIRSVARDSFAATGGDPAPSVAAVAAGADVLILMVLNSDQVEDVLFGDGAGALALRPDTPIILCSTVKPAYTISLAQRLAALDLHLLDAPVSGGTARAAEGKLSMMLSGPEPLRTRLLPVLAALTENLYVMGNAPGQGSTMKLVNQILAGIHIAAAAEAMAFGAKSGLDPEKVYEVICNSAGGSWMFQNRVPHILQDDYTPHSAIEIWVKDLDIILQAGKEARFPLPLSATAHQLYMMAAASGFGHLDDAAVVKVYEKLADFQVVPTNSDS